MNSIQVDVNDFTLDAPVVTKVEMEVMEMVLDSHVTMVVHYLNAAGNLLDNKFKYAKSKLIIFFSLSIILASFILIIPF